LDIPRYEIKLMQDHLKDVSMTQLRHAFDILSDQEPSVRLSPWPKLSLETALFKIVETKPAIPIDRLIEKIDDLKKNILKWIGETGAAGFQTNVSNAGEKDRDPPRKDRDERESRFELGFKTDNFIDESLRDFSENSASVLKHDSHDSPETTWEKLVEAVSAESPYLGANMS